MFSISDTGILGLKETGFEIGFRCIFDVYLSKTKDTKFTTFIMNMPILQALYCFVLKDGHGTWPELITKFFIVTSFCVTS